MTADIAVMGPGSSGGATARRPALAVVAFLLPLLVGTSDAGPAPLAATPTADDEIDVACVASADKSTYRELEPVRINVRICNRGARPIRLVGSLDGSERRRRLPWAYFTVAGPTPGWIPRPQRGCGNVNGLRESDIATLQPAACFDPFDEAAGFFAAFDFSTSRFLPGTYVVTFHYSTKGDGKSRWAASAESGELVADVARVEMTCETRVTIVARDRASEPESRPAVETPAPDR